MANLSVTPSYQLTETDILTVDKINLMATPVVDLSIETPVNDQNYFRNGNFYSAFWTTPGGIVVPPGVFTSNASYWLAYAGSSNASITYLRSTDTPDLFSLFSAQLVGAASGTLQSAYFGQQINGDLSATLRRVCTFSGYIENNSGIVMNPTLAFYTCASFNNFNSITLQATLDLPSCPSGAWTFVTASQDVSQLANAANGLFLVVGIPGANLTTASQRINFSRLKFQIGEVATEFSDDPSLFVQTPSIDSTMLQDGCIARPSLFAPNVIPAGSFVAGAIQSADIGAGQVAGTNLAAGAAAANLGYTPINKAGDNGVGIVSHTVDTVVGSPAWTQAGVIVATTPANGPNAGYMPAIAFQRTGGLVAGRAIGMDLAGRFRTADSNGTLGFLLDTVTGVDTASYQAGSITYQALAQSLINTICPTGMIIAFAGPNAPTGWLVCDGMAYPQSAYPALYAVIGTYWGAGSGGQQFQVPDFRGRAPIGYVNTPVGGITARAFASSGGEEAHVLNVNELTNHNHQLSDGTHSHTYSDPQHAHEIYCGQPPTFTPGTSGWYHVAPSPAPGYSHMSAPGPTNITIQPSGANISIAAAGGNAGHNNMQPFSVAYYLIKAT